MAGGGRRILGGSAPKKKRKFGWPQYILLCIICEVVQESIAAHTGWLLWPILPKGFITGAGVFGVVFDGVISIFTDEEREAFFRAIIRPDGMTPWEHFFYLARKVFYRYLRHNTLVFSVVILVIFLCVPAFAASEGTARWVLDVAQQVVDTVLPPETSPNEGTDTDDAANSETPVSLSPAEKAEKDDSPERSEADTPPEETDDPLKLLAERLVLSEEMDYEVSDEELGRVFFMDEAYCIEDWDDEAEIWSKVQRFAEDQKKLRRNPSFAEDVQQSILDQIAYASELEEELLGELRPTAKKLCEVINMRSESYDSAPSYRLAVLTRESFCFYADAYWEQGILGDAAAILYEKSIVWGFETLQYDVKAEMFKETLEILAERYAKLAQVLDLDSDERQIALKLDEVFQELAQEY